MAKPCPYTNRVDACGGGVELDAMLDSLIRSFPSCLQCSQEIWAAVGAEEFVVLDHGRCSDACRGQRIFDADHAGGEADADRVGERDVGREG